MHSLDSSQSTVCSLVCEQLTLYMLDGEHIIRYLGGEWAANKVPVGWRPAAELDICNWGASIAKHAKLPLCEVGKVAS